VRNVNEGDRNFNGLGMIMLLFQRGREYGDGMEGLQR
jgi:hypothetical protein